MQKTNLKLAPYFDDFDKSKNYHKILFKPGLPVQARELTQVQSALQNQIEEFGNHIFKDGSVVIPGQVGYDLEYHAVLVQNLVNGIEVETYRASLVGKTLVGQISGVEGVVVNTISVAESEKSTLTLYVKYTKSGVSSTGNQKTRFDNNEILVQKGTTTPLAITTLQNASAYTGSIAYITSGVYYIRGYFVQVDDQFVILDQYNNKPSYKIGLTVTEEIVSSNEDSTLFDNANGSTNFAAPGADRLKIYTTLSKDITSFSDNGNFIELLRLKDGNLEEIVESSVYNELERNLARRTYDESGDYTINDFTIKVKETLDDGENEGVYPVNSVLEDGRTVLNRVPTTTDPENSINGKDYYTIEVSPGKAYVRGYEINNVAKKYVTVQKPRTSVDINNKAANIDIGQYLTFTSAVGSVDTNELLSLRNSSNTNIGKAKAVTITGSKLYITDLTTYTSITVPGTTTGLVEGDFIFSTKGSRGVVNSASVSGSNTIIVLRQTTGKFQQNDVVSNSRNSITYTISAATDYNISQISNIINGSGFTANFSSPKLQSQNKDLFVTASELPVNTASDFSYVKVDKVSKIVSNNEVTISATNNFTPLTSGFTILSSAGQHTATASINGNTLVLSNISPVVTGSVDIYYKLRVNNTTTREKENKKYNFLSLPNKKDSTFTVYGNRLDDKEINLKFPDVYKVHRVHEAIVPGVSDNDMFDRVLINDVNGIVTGDILKLNNVVAKVISIDGNTLHVIYISSVKFTEGTNLTTQVVVISNPSLVGRFLTEVVHGQYKDITTNFALNKNDTDETYRISKLTRLGNRPTPQNKVTVVFDYLSHSQTNNDFFSANSFDYTEIEYKNIPNTYNGYSYTNIFDFRQSVTPTQSTGLGSVTAPFVCSNPLSAFDLYSNTKSAAPFPYPSEYISYDYNYYLGRIDRLFLDKSGEFKVSVGASSVSPNIPINISNALLLFTLNVPAYLKDVKTVKTTAEKTKRFTMKDIGNLETRIDNIEYYTTLSLLESDTNNLSILDSNGNDRFKNGFLVDNFRSDNFAATNNIDYKVSIDTNNGLVRPYPYINNIGLDYDVTLSGSNETVGELRKKGDFLLLPYTEVTYASNQYASRVVNLNPFNTITWVGDFQISPSRDVWYDTQRTIPENVPEIDLTGPIKFLYDRSGADGNQWGSWNNTGSARTGGGTNIFQQRNGVNNEFSSVTQNIDVGDRINSLESITFARSIVIDCLSSRMKPNTELYFFIDGRDSNGSIYPKLFRNVTRTVNSTSFVVGETITLEPFDNSNTASLRRLSATLVSPADYDSTLSSSYSSASTVIAINNVQVEDGTILNPTSLGSKIKFTGQTSGAIAEVELTNPRITTDDEGIVRAFILLPQDTIETGQSRFVLTDQVTNTTISGISDTNAVASYDSEGTLLDITSLSLDFKLPVITTTPISETRTVFIPDPPPPPPRRGDPLAQSFYVDQPGGMFISSIDLYFQSKDDTVPVTMDIRTIENGQPTENILPYSTKTLKASEVSTSANATSVTTFTFDTPVYVAEGNDYAFVVRTRSLNYKIWVSRLNEVDVTTNQVINKQPYLGSLYKSQNMSSWTADQFEDIKFNINRSEFSVGTSYKASLKNQKISTINLPADSLFMTSNSTTIRILHPNHCMHTIQNYVDISGVVSTSPNVKLVTNMGNTQTTADTVITLSDGTYVPTLVNNTNISDTNFGYLKIDNEIVSYKSVNGNTVTIPAGGRGLNNTAITAHNTNSIVQIYTLNGIPLTQINTRHKLTNVIDMDRFEISTQSKANSTLQTGGDSIFSSRNLQYESITPRINNIVLSGTSLNYKVNTITGSSISQKTTGTFVKSGGLSVSNLEINELDSSKVILSEPNQTNYYGSDPSFELEVEMSTTVSSISPLINISGSSVITAMNRINAIRDNDGEVDVNLSKDLEPSGSSHDAVYVTKKVRLENSATSVKVLFDGIRKQGVDIKVFLKYKRDDEIEDFNLTEYVEIPSVNYPLSPIDGKTFRAFEYEISDLEQFKEFAVKIVMIGDDQSNVPLIKNLRSIALAV